MNWLAILILAFAFLRFCIVLFNFISFPVLKEKAHDAVEKVSVLIPARNEAHRISVLLSSVARLKQKPFEVIIYSDQSEDNTVEVAHSFQEEIQNLKTIEGTSVPAGWVGKSFACNQLAKHSTGDYFLFLDADVEVKDNLIESLLSEAMEKKLALLSLFPRQKMLSLSEWLIVPLMNYLLLTLLPLKMVLKSTGTSFAAANGQCMFFDGEAYRRFQWHEQSKNSVLEDVLIAKKVKAAGLKAEVLLGDLVECRMYANLHEGIEGFRKNLVQILGSSVLAFIIYTLLTFFGFIYLLVAQQWIFAIIGFALIGAMKTLTSILSKQNAVKNLLLHLPQQLLFIWIGILSSADHLAKKTVWKGRIIRY